MADLRQEALCQRDAEIEKSDTKIKEMQTLLREKDKELACERIKRKKLAHLVWKNDVFHANVKSKCKNPHLYDVLSKLGQTRKRPNNFVDWG